MRDEAGLGDRGGAGEPAAADSVATAPRRRGPLGLPFNAAEDRLLRRALLWVVGLSVLGAPRTFDAAPTDVSSTFIVTYTLALALVFVALWRRWLDAQQAAFAAAFTGGLAALLVYLGVFRDVLAGSVTAAEASNVMLASLVAIAGITFVALPVRLAGAASVAYVVSYVGAMLIEGGADAVELLQTRAISQSLRYGVVAVALFWVVAALSAKRVQQREAAAAAGRRAQRRLRTLQEEQETKERLLAEAAHEIKGPLSVVRASAETLQARGDQLTPEQLRALVDALVRNVERLERRAQEVLTGARGTMRTTGPDGAPVPVIDAAELLDRALEDTQGLLDGWELRVAAPTGLLVAVSLEDFEHVLENLLSNAAKYSPVGTTVRVEVGAVDDTVSVTVTDQGGGLDQTEAMHLFEPYFRTDDAQERAPGDGVGLALVERLVRGWGGRVWCEPETDSTTFGFTMPRVVN